MELRAGWMVCRSLATVIRELRAVTCLGPNSFNCVEFNKKNNSAERSQTASLALPPHVLVKIG